MKKISLKKILVVILIALLLVICLRPIITYATNDWKSTTQFDTNANADIGQVNTKTRRVVGAILGVVRIVGTGIAIIMLIVVAMKYMMSAPGDRADIKKHAVVYVVGAIVLFGSAQIIGIIANFAANI